ncbi:MAG: hypothetical protein E7222_13130 [Clostridiales bacterium]|nr:hypothetical protein [Clostridiales bacterium]
MKREEAKHSLQEYKREYNAYFNGFLYLGRAISVLTTLSLYIIVPSATAFAIAVLIFEFLLIPAMVTMKKY